MRRVFLALKKRIWLVLVGPVAVFALWFLQAQAEPLVLTVVQNVLKDTGVADKVLRLVALAFDHPVYTSLVVALLTFAGICLLVYRRDLNDKDAPRAMTDRAETPSLAAPATQDSSHATDAARLRVDCDETTIHRINDNITEVYVRIRHAESSSASIGDLSVRIVRLEALEAVSDDIARGLQAYSDLPLTLRGDVTVPPKQSVELHPGAEHLFHALTLQRVNAETVVRHAVRWQQPVGQRLWQAVPSERIPNGRYRLLLVARGRDIPAVGMTIVFENRERRSGVWPEPSHAA